MKKILIIFLLMMFPTNTLFAVEDADVDLSNLFLNGLDLKFLLDDKRFTCIRPYYRRNYPLVRLGGARVMDGKPVGPFDVKFMIDGPGRIQEGPVGKVDDSVVAEIKGVVKAVQVKAGMLTEKQQEDLFLEINDSWIYEMPVEDYFPTDSGVLMNMKPETGLSSVEEDAKRWRMEKLLAKLDEMIAGQSLENKKAVELLDKEWYAAPSGFGERVIKGHRKMILIISQQNQKMKVEEVLFVIESPVTYYEETVAWCTQSSVIEKALKIGSEIHDLKAGK